MSTVTALRKKQQAKPKKDSELLTQKIIETIDFLHKQHPSYMFTERALKILCQSKSLLWRKDWLKLRRYILQKLEETK